MNSKLQLLLRMISKGAMGFAILGVLLFGIAGSLRYVQGWMFLITLAMLMIAMSVFLWRKAPETLARRLKSKESEPAQRRYIGVIGTLFVTSFALAGLDHRLQWSQMPLAVSISALVVMVVGYGLYAAVMIQNAYASRVVEIQKGQSIVTTGVYAVVRHPMYLAMLLLFLAAPFALGSYIAAIPMFLFPVALVFRIRNEETVLMKGLGGYSEYMQKTQYRLIPFIW